MARPPPTHEDTTLNTDTRKTGISLLPVAGLLVLAGICSDVRPALAQSRIDCPQPAGVAVPPGPGVAAQQVEDGSASLMDFALAAKEASSREATTQEVAAYAGCLFRQEGSAWRSGSTYIVSLTPDGRVFVHAKDMSLSGGLLNPLIYGAVLQELGISPADLTNPAAARAAFVRAIAGDGGPFDVPGIPGASGYATAYFSANFNSPIVLLAGFELDRTHLVEEEIDYGDPAVTARDVVDRATLKAFVTQAGEYFVKIQESGDLVASQQARIALRDPNGPWRHGSVYLGVMDPESRIILFHGAFPDRFELRRGGISRDAVTGELIVDQLIAAANSSPEGGFWQYHFDNPADDSDSAEVPKVGYARIFTGNLPTPGGGTRPTSFIVNSGFYLSTPEVVAASRNAVVESVLPQVMRAMTASTVDAVSARIEQATSGRPPSREFSIAGASTFSDALLANGWTLENDTFDPGRLLAGSSFTLPLNAVGSGGSVRIGNLTLWGSGDYRSFSGGNPQTLDYDGNVASANLGFDTTLSENLLAGMSVAQARGTVDYTNSSALTGELETTLTSVNPYLGWRSPGGVNLWATAGHGWGEVEVDDETAGVQASDLTQQMMAAGVSGELMKSDEASETGSTSLRIKAETAFTRADVDGSGTLESTTLEASRQRLVLEGLSVRELASGATFTPSFEVGMRRDGGDGETGGALEVGGGLRYSDPETGLILESRVRSLLGHGGDYEEWGVSGLIQLDPGPGGRGLAFTVQPAWGRTAGGVQRLWSNGVIGGAALADRAGGRMNAEIGYGLAAAPGLGVVTPYAGLEFAGESARWWRMGARWRMASDASLSLEGTRRDATDDDGPEHGLMLRGGMRW